MLGVSVSIVIKALNEERNIARAIESALRAVARVGGEVILADSASTDRTVEIASAYPILIVQLLDTSERCCGIGAQLGFQHAQGDFVYILDGDMEMHEGFLEQALACLATYPDVAGVGGIIREKNTQSLEYQARAERAPANLQPGQVDRLDMGGLYRREAIAQLGYLTDRNLHSYEEFDLGIRLRAAGWTLRRIPVDAIDHYGHTTDAIKLLWRRWKTRYIWGIGEVLRASFGKPHMRLLVRELRDFYLAIAVLGWWASLLLLCFLPLAWKFKAILLVLDMLFPWLVMSVKKRSFVRGAYAILTWCVSTAGLIRGVCMRRRAPAERIDVKCIDAR
ncbi:MAG: glycosyltransferase [Burkholderiales bacterium]|jgi:GT2 family glycosyltransferase|nr:glycosyltransferase [Burkholderiales bacterium]MBH2069623.1 glycosyltransferase [Burkholderiales bacterium]